MKKMTAWDAPIRVFGVPFFEEKRIFERVPAALREKLPSLAFLGRRTPGGRVGFRTDAPTFTVRATIENLGHDIGMGIFGSSSVAVAIGDHRNARYTALAYPADYTIHTFETTVNKSADMEEVTLWLPRNKIITDLVLEFPDDARVEAPTPYSVGPVMFYGSSITEGGCPAGPMNSYEAMLSRWLDMDFYNFGFSGSAKGELEMADYLATIPFTAFVYDYDHNAPDPAHLAATHEPFFLRMREHFPDMPILMMSKPDFENDDHAAQRRDIIRKTYENAKARGDQNVWFIDGETFFGTEDRELCTVDRCHPNDLGFYRMAKTIRPVLEDMLKQVAKSPKV